MRLPVRYFDSTQTGVLISRVMNDAEGIRNLVGTGLVQLVGSIVTAMFAIGIPAVSQLAADAGDDPRSRGVRRRDELRVQNAPPALPRARQDHRGGDRTTEPGARRRARGQDLHGRAARRPRVHQGRAQPVPQCCEVDDRRLGHHGVLERRDWRHRHRHDARRRPVDRERDDDARRSVRLHLLYRPAGDADRPDRVDRHPDHGGLRRPRPDPRDPANAPRGRRRRQPDAARRPGRRYRVRPRVVRVQRRACRC